MDRRIFLKQTGTAGLALCALAMGVTGCNDDKAGKTAATAKSKAKTASGPCTDVSGLSADDLATRTTFQYKAKADDPAKPCTTCNFWQAPKSGNHCGTCTLVKGPIEPAGGCISWVEIQPKTEGT